MKTKLLGLCLACTVLVHAAGAAEEKGQEIPVVPPRAGERAEVEIFNGKDLTGWIGHEQYWSIEDGAIVGKNTEPVPVSTYLLTEKKYTDFRLIFDFKLAESEMHSGIALWGRIAPEEGDKYTYAGHLVMFPSNYGFYDLYGRRSIYRNADVARPAGRQHDWNHIEILAQGNRIRTVVNGTLIADWREPEPERIKAAPIGLQLHSNKAPQEVRFKNLRLETFPEPKLLTLEEIPYAGLTWKPKNPQADHRWTFGRARLDEQDPRKLVIVTAATPKRRELINEAAHGVDLASVETFGDCTISVEVMVPKNSNSGIYVMGEYEIQILDSFGKEKVGPGDIGGLYGAAAPRVNAARPPGEWQHFEIEFRAPRFEGGEKVANANFVKVTLNGQVLHENAEMHGVTPGGLTGKETPRGPLMFQGNHGPVAYRSIKITPRD